MIRSITIILCVIVGITLTNLLLPYVATWVLFAIALVALILWVLKADPHQ